MKKLLILASILLLALYITDAFIWTPKDIKVIPVEKAEDAWRYLNNLPKESDTPLIDPLDNIPIGDKVKG